MLENLLDQEERQLQHQNKVIIMGKKRVIKQTEEEILEQAEKDKKGVTKKKKEKAKKKGVDSVRIYILASYNNTRLTITDKDGKVLAWISAGSLGFKGTKKSTPYAASEAMNAAGEKMEKMGVKEASVFVKGVGSGRTSALRALSAKNIIINSIKDITPIPHNGCRPPKARRL
jgi:small subunit ribosomal protein S11